MKHRRFKLKKEFKRYCLVILAICISFGGGWIVRGLLTNHQLQEQNEAIQYLNKKLSSKESNTNEVNKKQGNMEKGSIDVLAIGNSDLFSGFNPLQLWNEKGITSYAAGGSMQNMSLTYYMLEEILKYQKPKVVILELDNFFETRGNENQEEAKKITYQTAYPLFKNTALWKTLQGKSYTQKKSANSRTFIRGYYYKTEVKPNNIGYSYMGKKTGEEPMVKYTQKYFPKIMELLQKNNCEVIFTCFPSRTSWSYHKHNTVESYAQKYNVPYIDMNVDDYDIGFDWKTDTRDEGNHLNHSGATKVTSFFGNYLEEHYQLINHRGDANFEDWDKDYQKYFDRIKK